MAFPVESLTVISIHALREESDVDAPDIARGNHISIHALREESDWNHAKTTTKKWYFNPRSP